MFSHLTDFGYKRTGLQALGFYLTYVIAVILLGTIAGVFGAIVSGEDSESFSNGVRLGTLLAIVSSIGLSFVILKAKKISSFGFNVLAIVAGVLALLGGALIGFIIPAVFTTKGEKIKLKKTRK